MMNNHEAFEGLPAWCSSPVRTGQNQRRCECPNVNSKFWREPWNLEGFLDLQDICMMTFQVGIYGLFEWKWMRQWQQQTNSEEASGRVSSAFLKVRAGIRPSEDRAYMQKSEQNFTVGLLGNRWELSKWERACSFSSSWMREWKCGEVWPLIMLWVGKWAPKKQKQKTKKVGWVISSMARRWGVTHHLLLMVI